MPGPESLKAKCHECNTMKWCIDFKEGCSANISNTSVCIACTLAKRLDKLEKINKVDSSIGKEDKVAKLQQVLEAKNLELKEKNDIIMDLKKELEELKSKMNNSIDKVEKLGNIVKENRDNIVETGRDLVQIRQEICSIKDDGFQMVNRKKSAKTTEQPKVQAIPLSNRYTLLAEKETFEAIIIGDSLVRDQSNHFVAKNKRSRKVMSMRGCKVKKAVEEVKKLELSNRDSCLITNVGSNDLYLRGNKNASTEPIVKEIKNLVDAVKGKTDKGMIVGILPRCDASFYTLSKAIGINERIKAYCTKEKIKFLDPWDNFVGKQRYFKKDGIHLNTAGSKRLGDLLNSGFEQLKMTKSSKPEIDLETAQLFEDSEEPGTPFEGFPKEN